MRSIALISFVYFLSPALTLPAFAMANKDAAAGYYARPDYALVRLHGEAAKSLGSFMEKATKAGSRDEKLACNAFMCAFLIDRAGRVSRVQNLSDVTRQAIEQWDTYEAPRRGDAAAIPAATLPPTLPHFQVTVTGKTARFLFDFFLDTTSDLPYELKVPAMKCTHEPVSDSYECGFRVAGNGQVVR